MVGELATAFYIAAFWWLGMELAEWGVGENLVGYTIVLAFRFDVPGSMFFGVSLVTAPQCVVKEMGS